MFPRSSSAGSTSSAVSGALGVILGAALTLGIQLYNNHVQDQRTARQDRAQHIERLMIAGKNADAAASAYMFKLATLAGEIEDSAINHVNHERMMFDRAPVTELRAVSNLYLPEVQPEAERLAKAYENFCQGLMGTYPVALAKWKTGDPEPGSDPKLTHELRLSLAALEKKLIELAKQNRQ